MATVVQSTQGRRSAAGVHDQRADALLRELSAFPEPAAPAPLAEPVSDALDRAAFFAESDLSAAVVEIFADRTDRARRALRRLETGEYGICEDCGRPIPQERLDVIPETTRCVDCQVASEGLRF